MRIKNHGNQIKLIPERNVLKLSFMLGHFSGVKLREFNVLHNPSISQHYGRQHYSLRYKIESKHFKLIALRERVVRKRTRKPPSVNASQPI